MKELIGFLQEAMNDPELNHHIADSTYKSGLKEGQKSAYRVSLAAAKESHPSQWIEIGKLDELNPELKDGRGVVLWHETALLCVGRYDPLDQRWQLGGYLADDEELTHYALIAGPEGGE